MQPTISTAKYEIFFSIASEQELVESFRYRDQKKLMLPPDLEYPLQVRSYFTWQDPSRVYTYLVFKQPNWDRPRAVAFKQSSAGGEPVGSLCNWCHSYGSSEEIGGLSLVLDSKTSASYLLCKDLSCIEKIEDIAGLSGKSPEKQIAQLYDRIGKLFEGLSQYFQNV